MERWADRLGTELRLRVQLAVLLARDRGAASAELIDLVRALGVPAAEVAARIQESVRVAGPLSGSARWLDRVGVEVRELLARVAVGAGPGAAVDVPEVTAELDSWPPETNPGS